VIRESIKRQSGRGWNNRVHVILCSTSHEEAICSVVTRVCLAWRGYKEVELPPAPRNPGIERLFEARFEEAIRSGGTIPIETVCVCVCVCTCTESSSVGGASLFHLLDEDGVHWLEPVPLSPWQQESTCSEAIGPHSEEESQPQQHLWHRHAFFFCTIFPKNFYNL